MKISVVTVCLNSEATIGQTLESFLRQTHPEKELIVMDGGSTDQTLSIARSMAHPAIRIFSGPDKGIYDAMNKGLSVYRGDAVGFLNSDDTFHDSSVLASIAAGLSSADVVYGDLIFVKDHATKQIIRTWKAGKYHSRRSFLRGWAPPHPTFYIGRDFGDRVGLFDPSYGLAADYDFMLRAMELHAPRVSYIPRILVDFQHGGRSTESLSAYITANLLCLKSRRRHLQSPPLDTALFLKPLRKIHQFRWRS